MPKEKHCMETGTKAHQRKCRKKGPDCDPLKKAPPQRPPFCIIGVFEATQSTDRPSVARRAFQIQVPTGRGSQTGCSVELHSAIPLPPCMVSFLFLYPLSGMWGQGKIDRFHLVKLTRRLILLQ